MIDEFLAYNKQFVTEKAYEPYVTPNIQIRKLQLYRVWIQDLHNYLWHP